MSTTPPSSSPSGPPASPSSSSPPGSSAGVPSLNQGAGPAVKPKTSILFIVRLISNLIFWLIICALISWALPLFIKWVHGKATPDLIGLGGFFDFRLLLAQFLAGLVLLALYLWVGTISKTNNLADMIRSAGEEIFSVTLNTGSLFVSAACVDAVNNRDSMLYGLVAYIFSYLLWKVL